MGGKKIMWKEIVELIDLEMIATLRNKHGCSVNYTAERMKFNIEHKIDCHYFYYKSDKIKLIKGYKQNDRVIQPIAYTVICEVEDYPEAIRIMGQHTKEYLINNNNKIFILTEENDLNDNNLGVAKIGVKAFYKLMKEEYEKLGLKFVQDDYSIEVIL